MNHQSDLIVCGDFNLDFSISSFSLDVLKNFMHKFKLINLDDKLNMAADESFTYHRATFNHKSLIDHFLVRDTLLNNPISVHILHSMLNLSDHCPI